MIVHRMGVPGRDGGMFSVPGGENIGLTRGLSLAARQAAFDFAVFLTDPTQAAEFSIQTGFNATRQSAFETPEIQQHIAQNPQVGLPREIMASAQKELALQNLAEVRDILPNYFGAVFNGRTDDRAKSMIPRFHCATWPWRSGQPTRKL